MSGESLTSNELLLQALEATQYREAELTFVLWIRNADLPAASHVVAHLTDKQARRAGHAVSIAVRAKLLKQEDVEPLLRLLREKLTVRDDPSLKEAWQPDMAFDVGRLKQRAQEQQRRASYTH